MHGMTKVETRTRTRAVVGTAATSQASDHPAARRGEERRDDGRGTVAAVSASPVPMTYPDREARQVSRAGAASGAAQGFAGRMAGGMATGAPDGNAHRPTVRPAGHGEPERWIALSDGSRISFGSIAGIGLLHDSQAPVAPEV